MSLLSVQTALETILQSTTPLDVETVPLLNATGRVLAKNVMARFSQPPFDASAMDGYALSSANKAQGHKLEIVGTSAAGEGFTGKIGANECVRIYTGAPMPQGADAVIMQEHVSRNGNVITLNQNIIRAQNVRFAGNDFAKGKTIIRSQSKLTPFHITLAAAANFPTLDVHKAPHITIVATGDELVPPGSPLGKDQIIASNAYGLSPLFSACGATVTDKGIIKDEPATLKKALANAIAQKPDILITTGGASVGDRDYVKPVLEELGVELDFWKIAVRPGKPLMFGKSGNTLIFGLPGNPVSALATATVFVIPAIKALQNLDTKHTLMRLPLKNPLRKNGPREFYHRAQLTKDSENRPVVDASNATDSAHLTSLSHSDCFVVQKPFCEGKAKDELVDVLLLPWAVG